MLSLDAGDLDYNFFTNIDAVDAFGQRGGELEDCSCDVSIAVNELMDSFDANPDGCFLILGEHNGIVVAFTYGVFEGTSVRSGWFVVAANCRDRGIANQLHEFMVSNLTEFDVEEVLQVAATDLGEAFLLREGYEVFGDRDYRFLI